MSPTRMRKLPNQQKYRVYDGDRVTAIATTKRNAEKQVRLLRMNAHKKRPV
jgi:hypothetical protein